MFHEPEKHLVVGITKAKMAEMSFQYDEILPVARGEHGQDISFQGFNVIQVEQNDPETIQDMIKQINETGDIKPYIKQGFFDPKQIEKMFSTEGNSISYALDPDRQGINLVNLLAKLFEQKITQPERNLEDIISPFEQQGGARKVFNDNDLNDVLENLQQVVIQAYDIKECWDSLKDVMDVKSILGQLDEFKYIAKIMDNDKYDNPALNLGFYKVD